MTEGAVSRSATRVRALIDHSKDRSERTSNEINRAMSSAKITDLSAPWKHGKVTRDLQVAADGKEEAAIGELIREYNVKSRTRAALL